MQKVAFVVILAAAMLIFLAVPPINSTEMQDVPILDENSKKRLQEIFGNMSSRELITLADVDKDGKMSLKEAADTMTKFLKMTFTPEDMRPVDADEDGFISAKEIDAARSVLGIHTGGSG